MDDFKTLTGMTLDEAAEALATDFPQKALKKRTGSGGDLSSINPAYEIERLNNVFGLCGLGWMYSNGEFTIHESKSEKIEAVVTTEVKLKFAYFRGGDKAWSEPIPAHGQGTVHPGMSVGDAHKSAVTDALTKAASMIGVGISVFKGEQSHNSKPKTQQPPAAKPNPQQRADAETKNPPPTNGREYNRAYSGKESDPTVDIPAKFKTKPASGKSLIYIIDGKDVVFPIGHVRSFFDGMVEVTGWIADKKIESGDLAPELVCDYNDSPPRDEDGPHKPGDAPPPIDDSDVPF